MPAMNTPRKMVRIENPMRLAHRNFFFAGPFLPADEAVAAFLEARDEAAPRAARREGRASRCDAPEPPGSMMSFQSDRPLLVATYSPFQRIVIPIA